MNNIQKVKLYSKGKNMGNFNLSNVFYRKIGMISNNEHNKIKDTTIAKADLGKINIADGGIFEKCNSHRQVGCRQLTCGRSKSAVMKTKTLVHMLVVALMVIGGCCCTISAQENKSKANEIIKASGIKAGLCVNLGVTDGKLTAELSQKGKFVVQGLTSDAKKVEKARKYIETKGLYGRVSVERCDFKRMPYAKNFVNIVAAEALPEIIEKGLSLSEVYRIIAPYGALCFTGKVDAAKLKAVGFGTVKTSGDWTVATKAWPKEMDGWPTWHHGADRNPVSQDTMIGPATDLRWRATSTWDSKGWYSAYGMVWVSAGGRNFQITPKLIVARDSFNGIILWTRPITSIFKSTEHHVVATINRLFITLKYRGPLVALDAATGDVLKTYKKAGAPERGQKLVLDKGRLYLNGGAYDVKTGEQLWKVGKGNFMLSDGMLFTTAVKGKFNRIDPADGKIIWSTMFTGHTTHGYTTLFLYRGMLVRIKQKTRDRRSAKCIEVRTTETGKVVWTTPFERILDGRVYGAQSLIWAHVVVKPNPIAKNTGEMPSAWIARDPATGKIVRRFDDATSDPEIVKLLASGTHRCGPERPTEKYGLFGTYEFFDWKTGKYHVLDATRTACKIGLYPANSLVYTPMSACSCRSNMQRGSSAMAHRPERIKADEGSRLEKGPAYSQISNFKPEVSNTTGWPIYRHDVGRTGASEVEVPTDLKQLWEVNAASGLSAPTVSGGTVYVASLDERKIIAFVAKTGKVRWSYVTSGSVDTPPTINGGLVVFGTRDGRVTCLRATDGQLAWRFRAAPIEQRIMVDGRLESAWPVYGSVLVQKGVVSFSAGWHTGLDGGVTSYELELLTGKVLKKKHVEKLPFGPLRSDKNQVVKLPVALYQGRGMYLGRFGFRDSNWRIDKKPSKWKWSYKMAQFSVSAHYLVSGKDITVDMGWPNNYRGVKVGHEDFQIKGSVPDPTNRGRAKTIWGPLPVPVQLRAMILAGSSVIVAGRRDPAYPEKIRKSRGSRSKTMLIAQLPEELKNPKGALLLTYSAVNGKKTSEVKLGSPPVFDGLAASGGRVFVSCQDGKLRCFGKE